MPDPFAPHSKRRSAEILPDLQAVVDRLTRCGAKQEDIDATVESWPPPAEVLAWFTQCTDEELVAEIARVQDEYDYGTMSDGELAAKVRAEREAVWMAGLPELLDQSVPKVVAAVDGDAEYAVLVLGLEEAADGRQRSTLVAAMKAIVDAAAS